jgi:hypothetical protein
VRLRATVILAHGVGMEPEMWRGLAEPPAPLIEVGCRVIQPEAPWHGHRAHRAAPGDVGAGMAGLHAARRLVGDGQRVDGRGRFLARPVERPRRAQGPGRAGWTCAKSERWAPHLEHAGAPAIPFERIVMLLGDADDVVPFREGLALASA